MLSRRNIRIKVMQVLYAMNRDKSLSLDDGIKLYNYYLSQSFELVVYCLAQVSEIAAYAEEDNKRRKSKHLPDESDLAFQPVLADNACSKSLTDNDAFQKVIAKCGGNSWFDEDDIRRHYLEFSKSEAYTEYLTKEQRTEQDDRDVLLNLFKSLINSETFVDALEDHFTNWKDDKSLVIGTVKKILKSLPQKGAFFDDYRPQSDTTKDFGETLLNKVIVEQSFLLDLIKPTLKNWDADRVAVLDMILLKMALVELMSFATIPTKVTLNEFLEVSKMYSTPKSKDFINGILDRLMKQLNKQGMIKKEGRGLVE